MEFLSWSVINSHWDVLIKWPGSFKQPNTGFQCCFHWNKDFYPENKQPNKNGGWVSRETALPSSESKNTKHTFGTDGSNESRKVYLVLETNRLVNNNIWAVRGSFEQQNVHHCRATKRLPEVGKHFSFITCVFCHWEAEAPLQTSFSTAWHFIACLYPSHFSQRGLTSFQGDLLPPGGTWRRQI